MTKPALIAVDWGTSSLRAYLMAADGRVLDRVSTSDGILTAVTRGFGSVLGANIAAWPRAELALPILMSGMIGSRQGWVEAPYLTCPVAVEALASALASFEAPGLGRIAIVPGLSVTDAHGVPDVMRGEETQILGALAHMQRSAGTFVLPGTHSKWVTVEAGRIASFATYMTGEVYAALRGHTILGSLMSEGAPRGTPFEDGVMAASRLAGRPGQLLNVIFSARTLALFERLPPEDGAHYLSGLLIGAEIAAAAHGSEHIVLIGAEALTTRYARAAALLGIGTEIAPADCVTAGLIAIARAAGHVT